MNKTIKAISIPMATILLEFFENTFAIIANNIIKIANISITITAINIPELETFPPVWDTAIEAIFMGMIVTVISKANIVSVKIKTIILIRRLNLSEVVISNILK